jgi:hypothetical protein
MITVRTTEANWYAVAVRAQNRSGDQPTSAEITEMLKVEKR